MSWMLAVLLPVMWYVCLYFYIGYTYICWANYREGAGFPHSHARDFLVNTDAFGTYFGVTTWPLIIPFHLVYAICKRVLKLSVLPSPSYFYKQGRIDNDPSIQAEKHLLTEKTPWYKFGR